MPVVPAVKDQRSHVLVVLSNPRADDGSAFLEWYQGTYRAAVLHHPAVLAARHYEQHDVDINCGRSPRIPFRYMAMYDLSVDGAQEADGVISDITALHRLSRVADDPATWLYFPISEKVGASPPTPAMLVVAFANGVAGTEPEFREWYSTRHIRHALYLPELLSGQLFERTLMQCPGAMEARFQVIAVYEQVGTPEALVKSMDALPDELLAFPALDLRRFWEAAFQPLD